MTTIRTNSPSNRGARDSLLSLQPSLSCDLTRADACRPFCRKAPAALFSNPVKKCLDHLNRCLELSQRASKEHRKITLPPAWSGSLTISKVGHEKKKTWAVDWTTKPHRRQARGGASTSFQTCYPSSACALLAYGTLGPLHLGVTVQQDHDGCTDPLG